MSTGAGDRRGRASGAAGDAGRRLREPAAARGRRDRGRASGSTSLQFSGDEEPEPFAALAGRAIKAFRTGGDPGTEALAAWSGAWGLLFDAPAPLALRRHRARAGTTVPIAGLPPAGGSSSPAASAPTTSRQAIAAGRPCAVDVCSRVERPPASRIPSCCGGSSRRYAMRRAKPLPDAEGYFGPYGGRFVPETLMAPLAELTRAYDKRAAGSAPSGASSTTCCATTSAGPTPLYFAERLSQRARRRPDLPQARGPAPHRRAQDQQRHRPVPARPRDGQGAGHRRDRRRPARRRHRHRRRLPRPLLHRLHGQRGHAPPAAQRRPHAAPRRRGRAGRLRQPHAQGRHQRGAARLGHQRPHHPLRARLGARARTPTRGWCATSTA